MKRRKKPTKKIDFFLDSGAYSAMTQGAEIDIHEYIKFIKENEELVDVYANLDVIGDKSGPTKATAEATLDNQKIMEEAGLKPLPVFHRGEPEEYLSYYVQNYDYIGLGMGQALGSNVKEWLDRVYTDVLCDHTGKPVVKVHGFGMTRLNLMIRYPWYSVDSTSWVATSRFGGIFVPKRKSDGWSFQENPMKITVSSRSPGKKDDKFHVTNLRGRLKKDVHRYIHEKGYKLGESEFKKEPQTYELAENEKWAEKKPKDKDTKRMVEVIVEPGLSNKYELRDEMNIIYFQDLEKSMPKWPWPFKPPTETKRQPLAL